MGARTDSIDQLVVSIDLKRYDPPGLSVQVSVTSEVEFEMGIPANSASRGEDFNVEYGLHDLTVRYGKLSPAIDTPLATWIQN